MLLLGIALIVLGSALSLANWYTLYAYLCKDRYSSVVPLLGAILLGSGMATIPRTRPFAWLAVIADYGTLVLIISLPQLVYAFWSTSIFNRFAVFRTDDAGRKIQIKLFRRGIAVIQATFNPTLPTGAGGFVVGFSWMGTWEHAEDGYSVTGYASDRQLVILRDNGAFKTRELGYPVGREYSHDCLDSLSLHEA